MNNHQLHNELSKSNSLLLDMNYRLRRYELLGLRPNMNYAFQAYDIYCASHAIFADGKYGFIR